jgi:hypothetical protein
MNALDAGLSLWFIRFTNILVENNPLAEIMLGYGAVEFVIIKTFMVSGGCYLLWKNRDEPIAWFGVYACWLSYLLLLISFGIFMF